FQVSILAMATVLNPRFKKLNFKDTQACLNSIIKIKSMVKPMGNDKNINHDLTSTTTKSNSFWDHHHQLVQSHKPKWDIDGEMKAYLRMPFASFKCNPLQVWEGIKNTYPTLHKLALQFLPVVGSDVLSERVFSAASYVLSQRRNRIRPDRLARILFLQSIE
ncbi:hypothetical protein KR084_010080, partial [Drosophila pseudotakahashii]